MKKIFLLLIVLGSLFFFIEKKEVSASVKTERYLYLNDKIGVESIYQGKNFEILEFSDKIEYLYQNEVIVLKGNLTAIDVSSDSAFLIINHKLYKLTNGKIDKEIELDTNLKVNKIYYSNHLYLVGSFSTEGIIVEYSSDLKEMIRYTYGELNDLSIVDIIKFQNNFYLTCTKSAHSPNGMFENVGNYNETKTVVLKLNSRMNIEDVLYLNNGKTLEEPIFFKLQNDQLFLVVSSPEKNYYYQSSLDFSDVMLVKEGNNCVDILLGVNDEFIELSLNEKLKLETNSNTLEFNISNVLAAKIENGVLKVWSLEDGDIYEYNIEEYHIDYLNEFNIGFSYGNYDFEQDLNYTDVIKIESYFGKIEIYNQTIFTKNIPGTYDLSLLLKREGLDSIQLSTKVNVHPYVNITNEGVYKTGLTLYFLGSGTLNNEPISNGHIVTTENDYILEIKDNNGNVTTYQFSCVDDYYISDQPTTEINYFLEKDQFQDILVNLPIEGKVEEVVVDNQNVEFYSENKKLYIKIKGDSVPDVKKQTIDRIKIDGLWYEINQVIVLKTIKSTPSITINEKNNELLDLDFLINDPDKSLQKIIIKVNDEIIVKNYFENEVYSLEKYKNQKVKITLEYFYDLGDNVIRSNEVLLIEGKIKNPNNLITLNANVTHEIEKINLKVNTKNFKMLDKININEVNVANNYQEDNNFVTVFVSLFLTLLVILTIVFLWIKRRKKQKVEKSNS